MHIIWKRPDGFQNDQPEDFRRVSLSNGAQLWLHRHDLDWYPFQVSGDWAGQSLTARLNRLVNLLDATELNWRKFLEHFQDDELHDGDGSIRSAANALHNWLDQIKTGAKGNTWELDIVQCALGDIQKRLDPFRKEKEEP
jgi:hypothetical protein